MYSYPSRNPQAHSRENVILVQPESQSQFGLTATH